MGLAVSNFFQPLIGLDEREDLRCMDKHAKKQRKMILKYTLGIISGAIANGDMDMLGIQFLVLTDNFKIQLFLHTIV